MSSTPRQEGLKVCLIFCYAEDIRRLRRSHIDLLQGGAHEEMQRPEMIRDKIGISREFLKVSLGCNKIPCIV